MVATFTNKANLQPYDAITPTQSLTQPNTATSPLAHASAKLDFRDADEAPTGILNAAIWKSVKGPNSKLPNLQHADNH
jgi:hypothetical protein